MEGLTCHFLAFFTAWISIWGWINEWANGIGKQKKSDSDDVRKSLIDKAIYELVLNDQWELAKVRSEQDTSGLRRSWALLGAVKLSASPGQERQLNKWLKMNLEKATGNLKGSGELGLNARSNRESVCISRGVVSPLHFGWRQLRWGQRAVGRSSGRREVVRVRNEAPAVAVERRT